MKGKAIDFLSGQWITFYNQCKFVGNCTFNEFFIVSLKMLWYFEDIRSRYVPDVFHCLDNRVSCAAVICSIRSEYETNPLFSLHKT